jgi:hypothetical protein
VSSSFDVEVSRPRDACSTTACHEPITRAASKSGTSASQILHYRFLWCRSGKGSRPMMYSSQPRYPGNPYTRHGLGTAHRFLDVWQVTVWDEAADGLHRGWVPRLWDRCVVSPPQCSCGFEEQCSWPERTDARVGSPKERGLCRCQVPGSHPGPGPAQTAVVSPTKLCRVVPLAEGLRCKA